MSNLSSAELEAVLLRTLSVLDRHTGGRQPMMVERYLSTWRDGSPALARFRKCVEDVLRYRGIRHPAVQRTIAMIEDRYADSSVSQKSLAETVGLRPDALATIFNTHTGMNVREYLRHVRLDRAAALLTTTDRSVKEVWVAVGYNHASNFVRDFERRFGVSPREYRARVIHPTAIAVRPVARPSLFVPEPSVRSRGSTILIVEDDEGMRELTAHYFRLEGYGVIVAANGKDGLREATRVRPNVVLLDFHLPDLDGLECAQRLRRLNIDAAILIFSADWDLESRGEEFNALGAILLSKVCDLEDVRSALTVVRT
jgi:AraC-like DNA-binding protein